MNELREAVKRWEEANSRVGQVFADARARIHDELTRVGGEATTSPDGDEYCGRYVVVGDGWAVGAIRVGQESGGKTAPFHTKTGDHCARLEEGWKAAVHVAAARRRRVEQIAQALLDLSIERAGVAAEAVGSAILALTLDADPRTPALILPLEHQGGMILP